MLLVAVCFILLTGALMIQHKIKCDKTVVKITTRSKENIEVKIVDLVRTAKGRFYVELDKDIIHNIAKPLSAPRQTGTRVSAYADIEKTKSNAVNIIIKKLAGNGYYDPQELQLEFLVRGEK